jgi:transcriptional regulator with XRE-family HTH domain
VDLDSYLTEKKITDAAFAKTLGRSRSLVTKLRHGVAKPSAEIALKIEIATERQVCLADLLPSLANWAPSLPSPLLPLGLLAKNCVQLFRNSHNFIPNINVLQEE